MFAQSRTQIHFALSGAILLSLFLGLTAPVSAAPFANLPPHIQALIRDASPKKVIVLYRDEVQSSDISALRQAGSIVQRQFDLVPAISGYLNASDILKLAQDGRVLEIVPDYEVHAFLDESIPQIGANTVHTAGVTGVGAKVCIVDTGVDDSHPALPTLVLEYDFVNGDTNATDDNNHGTHVAGIIASNDATWKGVAPGVSLMAAKVLSSGGSGNASNVMAGVDWCVTQGADIINMSLGGGSSTGACDSDPLAQVVNAAVDQGVAVFVASGNSGRTNRISSPACASKAIAVGSVTKSDVVASYSNGGSQLDLTAPGSAIRSTVRNGGWADMNGTSMATPHAAAVGALIKSMIPHLTPDQMRTMLEETSVDLGATGFDFAYGHGRVDAYAAYLYALNGPPPPPPPPPPSDDIFFDDFQSAFSQWTETNQLNWNPQAPSFAVPNGQANNNVAFANGCNSAQGCILTTTSAFDLSSYESAELTFWRYVDRSLDNGEFLQVQVFDGLLWNTIFNWTNNSGDDDTWHKETFDLSSKYLTEGVQLRFITKESSSIEEVMIDDVLIRAYLAESTGPDAKAGDDQAKEDLDGTGAENFVLDGSASTDDGTITAYEWKEGDTVLGTNAVLNHDFDIGVHQVTLTITDDEALTASDSVQITVTENTVPVATAGADQVLSDGDGNGSAPVALSSSGSTDFNGGSLVSFEWKEGVTVLGTDAELALDLPVGVHTINLTVTDNGGATATDSVIVTVGANAAPVANAGPDQTLGDGDGNGSVDFTLDGSLSQDDGTIDLYVWKQNGFSVGTGATLLIDLPLGVHTFTLEVTDNSGQQDTDEVQITVTENILPVAQAGTDQTLSDADGTGAESASLDALASSDTDGTIVSYSWSESGNVLGTTAQISPDLSVGEHVIELTVTDNGGAQHSDTIVVTVLENAAPVANAGPDQSVQDQGGNGSEILTLNASGSSDPDGSIVSYQWKEGETVLGDTASLQVDAPVGEHTITLTVTDNGGAQSTDEVILTVMEAAPPPPLPGTAFSDDFESGIGNWVVSGNWVTESQSIIYKVPNHPNGNIVLHGDGCSSACTATLASALNTAAYQSLTLSFWRWIDSSLDAGEYLRLEVWNGSSWVQLAQWTNGSGDDSTWRQESFDLTPHKNAALKIRFTTMENSTLEEVEVDDVMIEGVQ